MVMYCCPFFFHVFFFNDTATTEIYTLSLHDALPILRLEDLVSGLKALRLNLRLDETAQEREQRESTALTSQLGDRKSTRLNSSHSQISYAVFCLKKKTTMITRSKDGAAFPYQFA